MIFFNDNITSRTEVGDDIDIHSSLIFYLNIYLFSKRKKRNTISIFAEPFNMKCDNPWLLGYSKASSYVLSTCKSSSDNIHFRLVVIQIKNVFDHWHLPWRLESETWFKYHIQWLHTYSFKTCWWAIGSHFIECKNSRTALNPL